MGSEQFTNFSADELRQYIHSHQEKDYLLVDVRQHNEYQAGHIAGARLLPLGELSACLSELPVDRDVIFY